MAGKYGTVRRFETAQTDDDAPGPHKLLPGTWKSVDNGWNMIALPFEHGPFKYRILMNQYSETLAFKKVSDNVENRGLINVITDSTTPAPKFDQDSQFVVALDYQQEVNQIYAEDRPDSSGLADNDIDKKPIHHESGLWRYMKNLRTANKDFVATKVDDAVLEAGRLPAIPHGNSVLALGTVKTLEGMPTIPPVSGLPIGRIENVETEGYDEFDDTYLGPCVHYINNPFKGGRQGEANFPGYNPVNMNKILNHENECVEIARTTELAVDSTRQQAGIVNIPFVVKHAEPVSMKSTFWIQELKEKGEDGYPKLRLQYSQVLMMDFFRPREDGLPSRAQWPHISINTLEKVAGSSESSPDFR